MDERDARSWCCSPYPNRYITKRHVNMMRVDQVKDGGKKLDQRCYGQCVGRLQCGVSCGMRGEGPMWYVAV